jgi:hypothetical protein
MKCAVATVFFLTFTCSAATCAGALVVLDFDTVPAASGGTLYPGATFAASGVTFTSGSIPNAVSVGTVFTLTNIDAQMLVVGNGNSISPPNFAAASSVFLGTADDLLMSFATPVTSLQLTTDDANPDAGGADVVRLLALESTGNPSEYRVLASVSGLDDAISSPGNLLSVNLSGTPFSFALFQATTEPEGFDNLTFNVVPEPSSFLLLAVLSVSLRRLPERRQRSLT